MNLPVSFLRRCKNALPLRFFWEPRPAKQRSRRVQLEMEILEERVVMSGIIQGVVYDDRPGSGQQQTNDPGLPGWTIQLLDSSNHVVGTTQTAADGSYQFANLTPGTYSVQEVLPSGWTQTAAPSSPIAVTTGNTTIANFGDFQNITVGGTVFDDANGDGQQQISEAGLPNQTVQLYTESGGTVSATPLQTTTTDSNGKYSFANLGPLTAGNSYVIAEETPAGSSQTAPSSSSDTITLPDGRVGYVVPAVGGVAVNGTGTSISGAGSYTLNQLNNSTTATVGYNDGLGDSGSIDTYLSQFNVSYSDGLNAPVTFNTFCIDLLDRVSVGQTYAVNVQTDLTPTFANGNRMAYIFQKFGEDDLTGNPDQAAAMQIALWDLSLNNHNPTTFKQDTDGSYSSGDESVFSVNLGSNPDAAEIATLTNQYLGVSVGVDPPNGWLQETAGGQSLLVPTQTYSFGNFTKPPDTAPGCG